jgi:periplasmic divalent cation tolerance protein
MSYSVCYVTAPTVDVAERLARCVVRRKLAACVTLTPNVTSVYAWEGKVSTETEVQLMMKTATPVVPRLIAEVQAMHPYDVPEIISVPMGAGSPQYLAWVAAGTSVAAPEGADEIEKILA